MEYCSGGSCGNLMRPGSIPEDYIIIIIRELLMGLEYLHNDNKLHRDIKGKTDRQIQSGLVLIKTQQLPTSCLGQTDKSS
jgi:serine/threonine protein kinase